jgi:hypothetical protein
MDEGKKYEWFSTYVKEGIVKLEDDLENYIVENEDVEDIGSRIDELLNMIFSDESYLHRLMTKDKSYALENPSDILGEGSMESQRQAFRTWLTGKAKNLFVGYPNEVASFPKKINDMENYALRQYLGEAYTDNLDLDSNFRREVSSLLSRSPMDVDIIDDMLNNFSDRNTRETLSFKRVFEDKTHSLNGLKLKSGASIDPETRSNFLQHIEKLRGNDMKGIVKVLEPLLDLISRYDSKQQGKTIIFSAPSITGKIDLRSLKNRKAIYSYWTGINKEYEVFQTKYLDFINAVDKIGGEDEEEEVLTPELNSIIEELKLFKNEIGSLNIKNNLNYVTKFGKMQLKGYMNKKIHIKLFVELLKDKKIINFTEDVDYETDAALEGKLTENQGAKAVSTYDKDTGQVTGTTAEIDEIKRTGQNSITATENKELEDILSKFKTVVAVDPIYYRAFTDRGNSEAFKNTPIFENQLKKLKKLLLIQGAKFDANYNTRISIDKKILEYVKELEDLASVTDSMTEFYLPLSSTTKSDLIIDNEEDDVFNNGLDSEDINRKSKNISKFLNTFSKIYDESVSPTATNYGKESSLDMGAKDIKGIKGKKRLNNLGTLNAKEYRSELIEAEKELDELLTAIIDFFVVPVYHQYVPFDDEIAFTMNENSMKTFKSLASGSSKNNSFIRLLNIERELGYAMISSEDIKELTEFINLINSPLKNADIEKLKAEFKTISSAIKEILLVQGETVIVDEINTELGAFLYETLENNNLIDDWFKTNKELGVNPNGYYPNSKSGKTPKDWDEEFNSNINYPFKQIINLILRHDASITSSSAGRRKVGSKKGIAAFKTALKDMKVLRSEDELKILDAHDSIRKMMGKPVYYNTSKTHNFDQVNSTIEIMKSDFNVDVSAHEINLIVNEVNSMDDISTRHGIPKEGVYFIKANFR